MSTLAVTIGDAGLATGCALLVYTGTVSASALTALLARSQGRRRAAQEVLRILLRRSNRPR
jgi:hypothetical protein